jgi:hypothetical protein
MPHDTLKISFLSLGELDVVVVRSLRGVRVSLTGK